MIMADEKTDKPAAKVATKTPALKKIKMLTGMAGFHQIPELTPDGKPLFNQLTGKPKMKNGAEFVRNPNMEYEVDPEEADRLIEAGHASAVAA